MNKYLAEFVGTFALSLIVLMSVAANFVIPTAVLAGVTLALMVYAMGHISGVHINPAVTIGLLSLKKISTKDALGYIASQVVAAIVALLVGGLFIKARGLAIPSLTVTEGLLVALAEAVGTFFFTFGIASVVAGKVQGHMGGVVIGASLFLGICFAATLGSNGILNPAVAITLGSFNLSYLLGPIIGSLLGMQAFHQLEKTSR
jgi:glycerol uptake facilitator-like aquaporin